MGCPVARGTGAHGAVVAAESGGWLIWDSVQFLTDTGRDDAMIAPGCCIATRYVSGMTGSRPWAAEPRRAASSPSTGLPSKRMPAGDVPNTAAERREALKRVYAQAHACTLCPELASTRKNVVFGSGNADADLMFIGEAPGASEDEQGVPFVGQAGKLLEKLLGEVGLQRSDVFIANTLKCLRYNAQVQLADRSWELIGRLVRHRYAGSVMSVDDEGRLVPRRVTDWHATPLGGRRVFRLATPRRSGPVPVESVSN